jgi:hypothetical protein
MDECKHVNYYNGYKTQASIMAFGGNMPRRCDIESTSLGELQTANFKSLILSELSRVSRVWSVRGRFRHRISGIDHRLSGM